jgi:hypothetical protein
MMIQIPGKVLSSKRIFQRPINSQPLGRIVAGTKTKVFLFRARKRLRANSFIARSEANLVRGSRFYIVPYNVSVAGFGIVGPCGPRTGNSSGTWPGNSSGRDGSPGSRTGGGTSGLGLPGGSSRGGSVGLPGVAGGISGGSIGITGQPYDYRRCRDAYP